MHWLLGGIACRLFHRRSWRRFSTYACDGLEWARCRRCGRQWP